MTPEALDKALLDGDVKRCLKLLKDQPESARRAAAKTALDNVKRINARWDSDHSNSWLFQKTEWNRLFEAAAVGVLGTATLSEIRRLQRTAWLPMTFAYEVLSDRRPEWITEWANWILENDPQRRFTFGSHQDGWLVIRRLLREGFIARPESDSYILSMIRCYHPNESIKSFLDRDPALLEHEIWRLFVVEGGREGSLAWHDMGQGPSDNSWTAALLELAAEGRLDRKRLLTASLEALRRDFAPLRAGWFSRFHENLNPTVDERADRTDAYLSLLCSRVPSTVSFALKALSIIEKAGRLNPDALIQSIGPVLHAREKGTVSLALRLLDRAAARNAFQEGQPALLAAEALWHPAPDVQGQALKLIEKYGRVDDAALRAELENRREDIAASLAPRLRAFLSGGSREQPVLRVAQDRPDVEQLLQRAAALDSCWAERAGVGEAVAALTAGALPAHGLSLHPLTIPRLLPDRRIMPIEDLDSLIDTFLSVIENGGPPDEVERVLDGVSRLCGERPADFERRTSALRKRARSLVGTDPRSGVSIAGISASLCSLALAWTEDAAMALAVEDASLFAFFHRRVVEIGAHASKGQACSLLSAPTHAGGWIDSRIAVERFLNRDTAHLSELRDPTPTLRGLWDRMRPAARTSRGRGNDGGLDRFDVIQALLRLAPDGREKALHIAAAVPGEVGDALRYALGQRDVAIGQDAGLWIAAARARDPLADHPEIEQRFPGRGPGAGRAPCVSLEWRPDKQTDHVFPVLVCDPECPRRISPDMPTVMHFAWQKRWFSWEFYVGPTMEALSTVWPPGRSYWFAFGACAIAENLDWWEARWGDAAYLAIAADTDTMLNGLALDMLVFGLAAKESGEITAATDVLIAAVSDGRITGTELGDALSRIIRVPRIIPARWARSLGDAARVSPLLALTVREAIERLMASRPARKPSKMVAILELVNELCAGNGIAISDEQAISWLKGVTGTGKAARLSKLLGAMKATEESDAVIREAARESLRARVERAERWQRA